MSHRSDPLLKRAPARQIMYWRLASVVTLTVMSSCALIMAAPAMAQSSEVFTPQHLADVAINVRIAVHNANDCATGSHCAHNQAIAQGNDEVSRTSSLPLVSREPTSNRLITHYALKPIAAPLTSDGFLRLDGRVDYVTYGTTSSDMGLRSIGAPGYWDARVGIEHPLASRPNVQVGASLMEANHRMLRDDSNFLLSPPQQGFARPTLFLGLDARF